VEFEDTITALLSHRGEWSSAPDTGSFGVDVMTNAEVEARRSRFKKIAQELIPVSMCCIIAWICLFSIGALISARCLIKEYFHAYPILVGVSLVVVYAYSNIAFLAFLSGALGGLLSNASINSYLVVTGKTIEELLQKEDEKSVSYRIEPPIASAIRSFAVYLLYIAGISIVIPGAGGGDGVTFSDSSQYIRMAGLVSAVGFAVGYDPTIFVGLLARLNVGRPPASAEGNKAQGAETAPPSSWFGKR